MVVEPKYEKTPIKPTESKNAISKRCLHIVELFVDGDGETGINLRCNKEFCHLF